MRFPFRKQARIESLPSTIPEHPYRLRWNRLIAPVLPWLSVVFLIAIIIVPSGFFAWLIFFTDSFLVQGISVLDARPHIVEETKSIIQKHLDEALVPHNIFFAQTEAMTSDVLAHIPEVRTVHITRQLPGTIKAVVQEKTPTLLFLSNGKYYFVDAAGIAYEEARLETLPGVVLPIVKNSDEHGHVTIGVPVVAESFVNFIQFMQKELPDKIGTQVAEIRIPSLSAREVHFRLVNNWELRFDVTREPGRQLDILKRLLAGTITPDEQKVLEYVDLRIPDRVYYKTRLGTGAPLPTTTPLPKPQG